MVAPSQGIPKVYNLPLSLRIFPYTYLGAAVFVFSYAMFKAVNPFGIIPSTKSKEKDKED